LERLLFLRQNRRYVRLVLTNISEGVTPMPYEPSLKVIHAFLDPGTPKALSLPLAALITGALSQVEAAIELTNRVYDSVFHESIPNEEEHRTPA
jgi:hypothetical protein